MKHPATLMNLKHLIIVLGLVCLGLVACRNSPAPEAATPASIDRHDHPQTLAAMTFNLRYSTETDGDNAWRHRKDDVIALIGRYQPDLLGVQEALPSQMQDLQHGLSEYASLGVGRDPDNQGEFSAIFYSKTKFQLLAGDTFWLSPTPDTPSKGWDAALNRICTWGLFRVRETGREFLFFNTHFDHVGEHARIQSARLILEKISALNPERLPVIVSGDFNLTDQERPIGLLSTAMQDSFHHSRTEHRGPRGTFQDFNPDSRELERIDYVFTSGFTVLTHAHLDERRQSDQTRYPSDHFPVLVELQFLEEQHQPRRNGDPETTD